MKSQPEFLHEDGVYIHNSVDEIYQTITYILHMLELFLKWSEPCSPNRDYILSCLIRAQIGSSVRNHGEVQESFLKLLEILKDIQSEYPVESDEDRKARITMLRNKVTRGIRLIMSPLEILKETQNVVNMTR